MSDTLRGIIARLSPDKRAVLADLLRSETEPIAIVGMGCHFPGNVRNPEQFWDLLKNGREGHIDVPAERWDMDDFYDPDPGIPGKSYVRRGGFLPELSQFDADFFGIAPREALRMDPQQRLLLETTWEAVEAAGLGSQLAGSATGVFIGMTNNQHILRQVMADPNFYQDPFAGIGSDCSAAAGRLAYTFDFRGPTVSLDTACSSSLVALHLACQSLHQKECDTAVVGGVYAVMMPQTLIVGCRMGMFAADGRCKTFATQADGYGLGEGCGIILLKRMDDALKNGDQIKAIIRGSAVNEDGHSNGLTAPNGLAQQRVIRQALYNAGISPALVSYVEAHGTGTPLGDPIEMESVQAVLGAGRAPEKPLWIGSVKTNLGHLYTAAGMAGIMKTVLALQHEAIPPHLNFAEPNPNIVWEKQVEVPTRLMPWEPVQGRRIAGVSSFGWSGTNAHVILEAALPQTSDAGLRPYYLLPFSAKTTTALETYTDDLHQHVKSHPNIKLADLAYTLQTGRQTFAHRRFLLCRDRQEALTLLAETAAGQPEPEEPVQARHIAFLFFTGEGVDYTRIVQELYVQEPVFRQVIDEANLILKTSFNIKWYEGLIADLKQNTPAVVGADHRYAQTHRSGNDVAYSTQTVEVEQVQLTAFIVEYALAWLLRTWGIRPETVTGCGLGATTAACVARVFSLEDGLNLIVKQAQMASFSPAALRELVSAVSLNPARIPYFSTLTGDLITDDQAMDPDFWIETWQQSDLNVEIFDELYSRADQVVMEIGLKPTQNPQMHRQSGEDLAAKSLVLPLLPAADEKRPSLAAIMESLGKLWVWGISPDWPALVAGETRQRVLLPTYPFERERFWVGPLRRQFVDEVTAVMPETTPLSSEKGRSLPRLPLDEWFYLPGWQQAAPQPPALPPEPGRWLLFVDECGVGQAVTAWLQEHQQLIITVRAGAAWQQNTSTDFVIRPSEPEDYIKLLAACQDEAASRLEIVHLWSIDAPGQTTGNDLLPEALNLGFYSLLYLAQALAGHPFKTYLLVITAHTQAITGDEAVCPEKATILGACRAIPLEYDHISCRLVDVRLEVTAPELAALLRNLQGELTADFTESVIALRAYQRWLQTFTPVKLPPKATVPPLLRQGGTYLITGGLGGLGLAVADYLVQTVQANVVLLGRSPLPPRAEWPQLEAAAGEKPGLKHKIQQIKRLERMGGAVLFLQADVSDEQAMATAVQQTLSRFGTIEGVIHAAGVAGRGLIQFKKPETVAAVFAPKVKGTYVLEQVLQDIKLDFLLLFSSIASFTAGGPGQADYSAANAFLDAYTYQCRGDERVTAVINWGEWQWNAWEAELAGFSADVQNFFKQNRAEFGIQVAEGMEALDRILGSHLPQIIVCTQDFPRLAQAARQLTVANLMGKQTPPPAAERHQRPGLGVLYVAPRNELECTITAVWEEALGVAGIGLDDNFFELGGNSLIGMNLIKRLQKVLEVPKLPDRILFEAPSVRALAQLISRDQASDMTQIEAQHARGQKRRQQYARRKQGKLNYG